MSEEKEPKFFKETSVEKTERFVSEVKTLCDDIDNIMLWMKSGAEANLNHENKAMLFYTMQAMYSRIFDFEDSFIRHKYYQYDGGKSQDCCYELQHVFDDLSRWLARETFDFPYSNKYIVKCVNELPKKSNDFLASCYELLTAVKAKDKAEKSQKQPKQKRQDDMER